MILSDGWIGSCLANTTEYVFASLLLSALYASRTLVLMEHLLQVIGHVPWYDTVFMPFFLFICRIGAPYGLIFSLYVRTEFCRFHAQRESFHNGGARRATVKASLNSWALGIVKNRVNQENFFQHPDEVHFFYERPALKVKIML